MNIALPTIGAEFHMDVISLSWIATAYLLAAALFLVPFGKIADIYGRKKVFLYGIGIFAAASLAMTMVPSPSLLIAIRVIQGLGSGMIFGTTVAILSSVFPAGERGKALGIYITSVYLGLSLGPFLGGVLTQYLGWRSIFFVNVPIGIAAILLVTWKLKGDWAECHGERFDGIGSVIYGIAIVAVMYGLSVATEGAGYTFLITGMVAAVVFVLYERRVTYPVLNVKLFTGNRIFAFSNLAALINYSATYAVTFLLSLYLQYTNNFTPEHAGLVLIAQPAVQAIVSPIAGKLSDRVEPAIVASAGMTLTAAGLFLLVFLTAATPLWYLIASLIVLGAGLGLFSSPNTNAIIELGREAQLRGCVGDRRDDAAPRPDALDGYRDAPLCRHHRAGRDHIGVLPAVPREHACRVHPVRDLLCRGDLLLACTGKDARGIRKHRLTGNSGRAAR